MSSPTPRSHTLHTTLAPMFGLLGTVMVLTRKLDWYGVGKRKGTEPLVFDLEAVQ